MSGEGGNLSGADLKGVNPQGAACTTPTPLGQT